MTATRKSYPRKDLRGMKFGKLTPIEWIRGGSWRCICDCGNETIVDTRNLMSGHTQSCGCGNYESKNVKDMTGYETETLRVIKRSGNVGNIATWLCECKLCGNLFVTKGSNIRFGYTNSCGCIHSLNEQKITKILNESGVDYETQYTFPDLIGVGGRKLRFDFAIFYYGELHHLIEYNGLQHYTKPNGSWSNNYERSLENDNRKVNYCRDRGIELRIIRYDQPYSIYDLI